VALLEESAPNIRLSMPALDPPPALNRAIALAVHRGCVRAALEDDFHHFRVVLRHDGRRIVAATSESLRHPHSLCPAGGERLNQLVGAELAEGLTKVFRLTDPRQQCTHQFDLAALAIAAAARGSSRHYHARVPDLIDDRTDPQLWRDGESILSWRVQAGVVTFPARYSGITLRHGFTDWAARELEPDEREAAIVLRRAVMIAVGRGMLPQLDRELYPPARGGCWVMQPERNRTARRVFGSVQDFSARSGMLLGGDVAWLAGST